MKSFKQTCLEELDSLTKINELVLKYPKIDKEWQADHQVSQWLMAIQMSQSIIDTFVQNQIDGYALLELNKDDLEDMLQVGASKTTGSGHINSGSKCELDQIISTSELNNKGSKNNIEYNEININIFKILAEVKKLKIIWYKTLKKLKMLEECRDVLLEFGIIRKPKEDDQGGLGLESGGKDTFDQKS